MDGQESVTGGHDLVIFGGTGDLTMRKLLPALYYLQLAGSLGALRHIVAVGRTALDRGAFLALAAEQVKANVPALDWQPASWESFAERIDYVEMDVSAADAYARLGKAGIGELPAICYLAIMPRLYGEICDNLKRSGLLKTGSRVVLEKPLGHNLASSVQINEEVAAVFGESETFRIDHYLGKETVQNLIALRFGNPIFSHIWSHHYIDSVQISVAETIGVEGRGGYYGEVGALRDMLQNHLLQILCLVAMEPPNNLDADAIRDEKMKVLNSLARMDAQSVRRLTVSGQYGPGVADGTAVSGFLDQAEYAAHSGTETYVAVKAEVANWRWAGVPFYLRTGKRLATRYSEIVIQFKPQVHSIFALNGQSELTNALVMRLQPRENVTLLTMSKVPGLGAQMLLRPVALELATDDWPEGRSHDAYERLLLDIINNDQTLFMRRDEVEGAWRWADSILESWRLAGLQPKVYAAGTMGPGAATSLIERDGRSWHESD